MAERQQALADGILEDPDVESLSLVHRRRRHQHDAEQRPHADQPQAARRAQPRRPARSSAACSARRASVPGISLYMQPVAGPDDRFDGQPHPVPVRPAERQARATSTSGCRADGRAAAACPRSSTSPATCRQGPGRCSSRSTATPPRASASPPATIDNALYDAFGQRIVSTIFTQSNQYRVILEAEPSMQHARSIRSANLYLPSATARQAGAAVGDRHLRGAHRAAADQTISASSRPPRSRSTWRRAPRSARRSTPSQPAKREIGMPASA